MLRLTIWMMVVGCSSSYVPQSRGRVAVTMQGGGVEYVRDGQHYSHGLFGSGLEEAVAGDRRAEEAAGEYHERVRDGVIATLVGSVCLPSLLLYAVSEGSEPSSQTETKVATLVGLGCTALLFGGLFYTASAEPYRWDAINQFNDDAATLPPGINLGAAPAPKTSLGMR